MNCVVQAHTALGMCVSVSAYGAAAQGANVQFRRNCMVVIDEEICGALKGKTLEHAVCVCVRVCVCVCVSAFCVHVCLYREGLACGRSVASLVITMQLKRFLRCSLAIIT